jgi:hypothetical protein
MARTCTAQILIGHHPYGWGQPCRGMGPLDVMYLVEGSRASWFLEPVAHQVSPEERTAPRVTEWILTRPERILADGLLLLALNERDPDPNLIESVEEFLSPKDAHALLSSERADLTRIDEKGTQALADTALDSIESKLVVTVMEQSAITGQLALLERCSMYAEVCTTQWIRSQDMHGEARTAGELPPENPDDHGFYAVRS